VMRADNDGEGGIMALITMLKHGAASRGRRTAAILAALGLFGASLFFGDSMITPAISVLSAVEGIKTVTADLEDWVVPIGKAKVRREGSDVTLVAYSRMVGFALKAAEGHEDVVKGFVMVSDELKNALNRVGIQPFSPEGEPFDPNEHEAMAQVPSEDVESGTVVQVYQSGYRINGAVLRPARVVVAQ